MFNWFRKKKKETPQNAVIPAEDRGLTVSCTALSADLKIDDKQLIRVLLLLKLNWLIYLSNSQKNLQGVYTKFLTLPN